MEQEDVWDRIFNKIELTDYHITTRYDKRLDNDNAWRIINNYYETIKVLYNSEFYQILREETYEQRGLSKLHKKRFKIFQNGRSRQIWGKKRRILKHFAKDIRIKERIHYGTKYI